MRLNLVLSLLAAVFLAACSGANVERVDVYQQTYQSMYPDIKAQCVSLGLTGKQVNSCVSSAWDDYVQSHKKELDSLQQEANKQAEAQASRENTRRFIGALAAASAGMQPQQNSYSANSPGVITLPRHNVTVTCKPSVSSSVTCNSY